jgi:hypothetical protein
MQRGGRAPLLQTSELQHENEVSPSLAFGENGGRGGTHRLAPVLVAFGANPRPGFAPDHGLLNCVSFCHIKKK